MCSGSIINSFSTNHSCYFLIRNAPENIYVKSLPSISFSIFYVEVLYKINLNLILFFAIKSRNTAIERRLCFQYTNELPYHLMSRHFKVKPVWYSLFVGFNIEKTFLWSFLLHTFNDAFDNYTWLDFIL